MEWMVQYSAELISRYSPKRDGKTARHLWKGSQCDRPVACFGESVWWLPPERKTGNVHKLDARMVVTTCPVRGRKHCKFVARTVVKTGTLRTVIGRQPCPG